MKGYSDLMQVKAFVEQGVKVLGQRSRQSIRNKKRQSVKNGLTIQIGR